MESCDEQTCRPPIVATNEIETVWSSGIAIIKHQVSQVFIFDARDVS